MALAFLSLRVPRESENTPEQTAQLLASLARITASPGLLSRLIGKQRIYLSLEVTLVEGQIIFIIGFPEHLTTFIQSQMLATYPDVAMHKIKDPLATWPNNTPPVVAIRQSAIAYFPLRDYMDYKEVDPMLPLLGILSKAGPQDRILIQFILTPPSKRLPGQAYTYLHPVTSEGKPANTLSPGEKKIIEDKLSQPLVGVSIRFAASDPQLLRDLGGAVSVLNRPDGNTLVKAPLPAWDKPRLWKCILSRSPFKSLLFPQPTLNVMELSSLWHLPGIYTKLSNVAWAPSSSLAEPPENLPVYSKESSETNAGTNFFATTTYKNEQVIFGLKLEDRLRHVYILGKSGTGKSTLLENMAVDDFKKGKGVAFIDPHGDSAENLLNYIPKSRINDAIYFNPADREHPISLNMLQVDSPDQAELVASSIVAIFHKLYGHSWGPRLEYILRNSLLTLTQVPNSTLPDVVKLLTDSAYRKQQYRHVKNEQLLSFWQKDYDSMDDKMRLESIGSILNKVGQFVNSPLIHNIISHPKSSVNLKEVLNSGKIFIANLSQGKLGEDNSALLGAMLVTQIELAAMSRVDQAHHQRKEFFLYVDEFQNYATESFIKILSEARKYRLGLTLANQYMAQIPESIQKAIFGNAGSMISFVLGSEDARIMSQEFGEKFSVPALVSLQKHQIALKITIDGAVSLPFSAQTLPPLASTNQNRDKVIANTHERYSIKK